MSTICSAFRKAMLVGDNTVGTSTNCSADCGSGTRERDGHGGQEILGTSIACSAIGQSRIRKASVTSPHRKIENLHKRADGSQVLHVVPLNPIHHHWRHGFLTDTRPPSH